MDRKTLPCVTHISTGDCPYKDRCEFIHDEDLKGVSKSFIKMKNDSNLEEKDLFYYPKMRYTKEDNNVRKYYIHQKEKINRLPIMVYLSQGGEISKFRDNNLLLKLETCMPYSIIPLSIISRRNFSLKETQGSNMYNNLIRFIKDNKSRYEEKNTTCKFLKIKSREVSPISVTNVSNINNVYSKYYPSNQI